MIGGEGVVEVGGGVGGNGGRVVEENSEDDGELLGVGGSMPCGAGGFLLGGL